MTRTRTAACGCGQLTIEVKGEPLGSGLCHCLACQRRTGSVFAAIAEFAEPWTVRGRFSEWVRTGDARARFRFRFCPECGTNLFHTEEGSAGSVSVAVGALADPAFPQPTDSVYDDRRHAWVRLPDGITVHARDPV